MVFMADFKERITTSIPDPIKFTRRNSERDEIGGDITYLLVTRYTNKSSFNPFVLIEEVQSFYIGDCVNNRLIKNLELTKNARASLIARSPTIMRLSNKTTKSKKADNERLFVKVNRLDSLEYRLVKEGEIIQHARNYDFILSQEAAALYAKNAGITKTLSSFKTAEKKGIITPFMAVENSHYTIKGRSAHNMKAYLLSEVNQLKI